MMLVTFFTPFIVHVLILYLDFIFCLKMARTGGASFSLFIVRPAPDLYFTSQTCEYISFSPRPPHIFMRIYPLNSIDIQNQNIYKEISS